MFSGVLRGIAAVVVFSTMSGCAFTQWTDSAFYGSSDCPPRHPDREWAFALAAPFAMVGDVITAPVQGVMLAAGGDFSLYRRERCYLPRSRSMGVYTEATIVTETR